MHESIVFCSVYDFVVKKVHVRYLISWWVSCFLNEAGREFMSPCIACAAVEGGESTPQAANQWREIQSNKILVIIGIDDPFATCYSFLHWPCIASTGFISLSPRVLCTLCSLSGALWHIDFLRLRKYSYLLTYLLLRPTAMTQPIIGVQTQPKPRLASPGALTQRRWNQSHSPSS